MTNAFDRLIARLDLPDETIFVSQWKLPKVLESKDK